ncbi:glutamate--tRNA ligase [Thermaurantimonas aggregans]|uniref:glutamate--tRNA ligase n=1 Tax=Thermaurantimonas aggregans TaxID=2173829 RepID=UPI0023F38013|nr:glutamate--tRNA ligase [Thermaurantimonas aggregans]MCX8149406.1 glutamate--tRNA ligase [Thermaurantimonas aggregans]
MRRVRFAPSPTGPLHMGGVRTALYNYLFAKQDDGKFLIRIEDTDQTRTVSYAENYIFETLEWLGLIPDEGYIAEERKEYKQSNRKELYKQFVNKLLDSGAAYIAFDTPEELENIRELSNKRGKQWQYDSITRQYMRNSLTLPTDEVEKLLSSGTPHVVRLKLDRNEEVRFDDMIRGTVVFNTNNLDDKILFKSDGMPTYHLANVVDDHLMNITHVIRGEEWLPSTPIHVLLYKKLGLEEQMPKFAHLPLLLRPDGNGKLSKRDGEKYGFPVFPLQFTSENNVVVKGYKEIGFLPEAFINMLALLGWNPGTEQEIFSREELIQQFSINRISKSGAKFSYDKALWINHNHIKNSSSEYLFDYITKYFPIENLEKELFFRLIEVDKVRVNLLTEILEDYRSCIDYETNLNKEFYNLQIQKINKPIIENLIKKLKKLEETSLNGIDHFFKNFLNENNIKIGAIGLSLRALLMGKKSGPAISEIIYVLGKELTIKRLEKIYEI